MQSSSRNLLILLTAISATHCLNAAAEIYVGGVSGCGQLANPGNSPQYRADGGHVYIHSVGWDQRTTEAEKSAIIELWIDHKWGIEMGFSTNNYTARQNAYRNRYLDRGIRPEFITVNAYSSARVVDVEDWRKTVEAYRNLGVSSETAIYATFEYQNMPEYWTTLENNYVSDRIDFQQVIEISGGMTLDIPPTVYFRRMNNSNPAIRKYHDWILDAVKWAQSEGHRVGIIVSPNSAGTAYPNDVEAFVQILRDNEALPDFFVVENYANSDASSYANEVGNEWTPHHQLGTARLMQTEWFPEAMQSGGSGEVTGSWAGYDVLDNRTVDTGAWLGMLEVDHAPFIYSEGLNRWMYLPEELVTPAGSWTFVYR
jgi:hypothetical protein